MANKGGSPGKTVVGLVLAAIGGSAMCVYGGWLYAAGFFRNGATPAVDPATVTPKAARPAVAIQADCATPVVTSVVAPTIAATGPTPTPEFDAGPGPSDDPSAQGFYLRHRHTQITLFSTPSRAGGVFLSSDGSVHAMAKGDGSRYVGDNESPVAGQNGAPAVALIYVQSATGARGAYVLFANGAVFPYGEAKALGDADTVKAVSKLWRADEVVRWATLSNESLNDYRLVIGTDYAVYDSWFLADKPGKPLVTRQPLPGPALTVETCAPALDATSGRVSRSQTQAPDFGIALVYPSFDNSYAATLD